MHGLHCSVMERLQTLPAYANDRVGRISTYLSKNYRSHPALVRLLARISYENKLSSVAPTDKVMALQVPIVVLGVCCCASFIRGAAGAALVAVRAVVPLLHVARYVYYTFK